eukprot:CAMPEP_0198607620 /NCGR_PEP_ID=MMETSP1462-20131121/155485_1 /TAXON_ID=1333877 /ORGANISM="Brandtodinium nutriculum, Strain RCC3387" /LENGTH=114 /DNA_ID=CAMNT_0044339427 /DNA_START=475 /DNA_END=819 /DNA_ORIENTATION=+
MAAPSNHEAPVSLISLCMPMKNQKHERKCAAHMMDKKIETILHANWEPSESHMSAASSMIRMTRTMRTMPTIRMTRPSLVKRNILMVSPLLMPIAKLTQSHATTKMSSGSQDVQ